VPKADIKKAAPKGDRVYTYTNQNGDVFFSFKKMSQVVTPSQNLKLVDRVGSPFDQFLSELRVFRRFLLSKRQNNR
jgi:hypothetical protein